MYSEKFLKAEKQDGSPRSVIVIHDRLFWVLVVRIARTYHVPRWRETWVLWGVKCLFVIYVM